MCLSHVYQMVVLVIQFTEIENTRKKTIGAFIELKSFLRNSKLTWNTRLWVYKTIVRSLFTYVLRNWGPAASHTWFKRNEQIFTRTFRSAMQFPWFIRNVHLLKKTNWTPWRIWQLILPKIWTSRWRDTTTPSSHLRLGLILKLLTD